MARFYAEDCCTPSLGLSVDSLHNSAIDTPISAAFAETRVIQLEGEIFAAAVGDKGGLVEVGVAGLLVGDNRCIRTLPGGAVFRTQEVEVTLLDSARDYVDEADVLTVVELDIDVPQALAGRQPRLKFDGGRSRPSLEIRAFVENNAVRHAAAVCYAV